MENTKALKKTIDTYVATVESISKSKSIPEINEMEHKCIRALQLAQVQVMAASKDLYATVQQRKKDLAK